MAKHRYDSPATRHDLIDSARSLFSETGYSATRTEEVVRRAGLSRGALYHHFANKEGLFTAVLETVHTELATAIARDAGVVGAGVVDAGPLEALRAGFHTWLDVALRDDVRQILLVDGPAVVGWEAWHEIDRRHGFGVTRRVLERAMQQGEIAEAPLDELTNVLLGAVSQAGLELGRVTNRSKKRKNYHQIIDLLIDGISVNNPA